MPYMTNVPPQPAVEDHSYGLYEVTLPGFDGGTDETDDLVLWMVLSDEEAAAIKRMCCWAPNAFGKMPGIELDAAGIDFDTRKPGQLDALKARLSPARLERDRLARAE
ncbi:hypothetical protein [Halomonas sp. LBP4]|uniref:hypothetical protein n=1 Tax=Halomonas sp. LBP4 TaxID=2044917 RepID=UPI000D75F7B3|nr:hypothetical protein [Halomonas sp. LBP4]PXX95856.1 hypothetical protein CR157_16790 [Halomonas sp. LBP4]